MATTSATASETTAAAGAAAVDGDAVAVAAAPGSGATGGSGPAEVPAGVEAEAALLGAFSEVPTISRAVVRKAAGGSVVLTATCQQRNLFGNAQRRFNIVAALSAASVKGGEGAVQAVVGLPQEVSADVLLTSVSPSGGQQLVVLKGHNDTTSALLQLWKGARLVMELAVPKALHGPLVNDGYFASGVSWAADESAVAYTAETPATERTPNWLSIGGATSSSGSGSAKEGDEAAGAAPRTWKGVGATVEDWGELNTGKRPPAPYVVDLIRREVLKIPGLPDEHSVGQPTWCPPQPATSAPTADNDPTTTTTSTTTGGGPTGLVFVAWPHRPPPSFPRLAAAAGPRKLGVVFCYNRSAHLYHISVQRTADGLLQFGSSAVRLCPSLESCLSPTFSPGGEALVFVSHEEAVRTGTHGGTGRLYRLDWPAEGGDRSASPSSEPRLLVDVVQRPPGPSAFPGLYTASIPDDGFVGPSTLLLNTQWGAVTTIAAIDINGQPPTAEAPVAPVPLTPVEPNGSASSWSLLAAVDGLLVANRVAPDCPGELYVATLPEDPACLIAAAPASPPPCSLTWRPLGLAAPTADSARSELPPAVQEALDNLQYTVLKVPPRVGDCDSAFDCLVWAPRSKPGPRPAVIAPHGGPHTAVTLGWYPPYAYLAALGYVVLSPNYRGSTGYGQAALSSLPGHIGKHDVDDCMAALQAAVEAGLVDPSAVSVVGGSHGGFLTAHLLGQHPWAFRSGVMRNPVTNISAMVAASDIPDWCYVEVFGCEEGRRRCTPVPTPNDLAAMYDASPAKFVDDVTAPVYVMLGAKDRRVPPPDGLQYLTALRGRDVAAAGAPPPSRLIIFPEDAHGLDKPQTEYEQWLNVVWWLKQYGAAPLPPPLAVDDAVPSQ